VKYVIAFLRFWYDFVVGDDWRVAAGVVAAIVLTAVLADAGVAAWWLMPVGVLVTLFASLWREARAAWSNQPRGSTTPNPGQ
jgi:hypothetical protein